MTYNLTVVDEAENFYQIVKAVNDMSGGLIAVFTLGLLFLILFATFKKFEEDTKAVLLFSSTIITIISILMWAIEFIAWHILIIPVLMMFGSIIIYKFS